MKQWKEDYKVKTYEENYNQFSGFDFQFSSLGRSSAVAENQ